MGLFSKNGREDYIQKEIEKLKTQPYQCSKIYPHGVFAKLHELGYKCEDDGIEIGDLYYPIKFYMRTERLGKIKKQNLLSVFIFGYMPEDADLEFLKSYMKGLDRMIATYTDYSTAKYKAGMSLCIEQDTMTDFVADYCIRENSVNAFLGNIPLVYEKTTGNIYVKLVDSMPLHYEKHLTDLKKAFLE